MQVSGCRKKIITSETICGLQFFQICTQSAKWKSVTYGCLLSDRCLFYTLFGRENPFPNYVIQKKTIDVDVHASYKLPIFNQDTCFNNTTITPVKQIQEL